MMIAEKLAIDYAESNLGLKGAELQDAMAAYQRRVVPGSSPAAAAKAGQIRTPS